MTAPDFDKALAALFRSPAFQAVLADVLACQREAFAKNLGDLLRPIPQIGPNEFWHAVHRAKAMLERAA